MSLELSYSQNVYLNSLDTKYRAFVGGFGSGKTFVGCLDLAIFAGKHPKTVQGYFAPTYPNIRDIFYPTFDEAASLLGFRTDIKESNKEVHLYRNGFYYGTVICRSMDNPKTIIGFKISRALVDEIDTLTKIKAQDAWNKIIARLRLKIDGIENGVGVTTTPEGFLFVYSTFKDNPTESYSMIQSSTYENEKYLPDDYIQTLKETYPEELADAYIDGEFVNLTSGSVYRNYDRKRCESNETIRDKEPLFVGQDFNVYNMASVIYVKRGPEWHAVDELTGLKDTPDMLRVIGERFPDNKIIFYPDSSGKNRKSSGASTTDIRMIEAEYSCRYKSTNPLVKDRVLSMNTAFDKGLLKVNSKKCPEYVKGLEQQVYDDNGEPDKKSGLDHQLDAGGYPIAYEMPVNKPTVVLTAVRGM